MSRKMIKYSKQFQHDHDLDLFYLLNGKVIHIASAGCEIPDKLNNKTINTKIIRFISSYLFFSEEETAYEIIENEDFIRQDLLQNYTEEQYSAYIETFRIMAEKGFYSYDKTNIIQDADGAPDYKYHWVTYPIDDKKKNKLIDELLKECDILEIKLPDSDFQLEKDLDFNAEDYSVNIKWHDKNNNPNT